MELNGSQQKLNLKSVSLSDGDVCVGITALKTTRKEKGENEGGSELMYKDEAEILSGRAFLGGRDATIFILSSSSCNNSIFRHFDYDKHCQDLM